MLYRSSHSVYDCRYHLIWATKYRKRLLGAYDYRRQLERGYSVTRDSNGRVLRFDDAATQSTALQVVHHDLSDQIARERNSVIGQLFSPQSADF